MLDVQRLSTQDGPGIRTTVFLEGCTNACAWCHNPESIRRAPELQVHAEDYLACGACARVRPAQVQQHFDGNGHSLDRFRCGVCGRCVAERFAGALTVAGERVSAAAVREQVVPDAAYYRHSGGGLSVSGGSRCCSGISSASCCRAAVQRVCTRQSRRRDTWRPPPSAGSSRR